MRRQANVRMTVEQRQMTCFQGVFSSSPIRYRRRLAKNSITFTSLGRHKKTRPFYMCLHKRKKYICLDYS